MAWSEDRLHLWLARQRAPRGLAGSRGHDAAVLHAFAGRPVVCTDSCIEGVHFERGARAALVGAKAVARTLSDLAATGARARAVLLALTAPATASERWLQDALRGARRAAHAAGADLVGGDLAAHAGPIHLCASALGEYEFAGAPPGRARARPGDVLLLTGPVGGSRLGRHLRIHPRLEAGHWLAREGAHALMDVSDGLAWDLHRLARSARAGIELELAHVPVHPDAAYCARASGRPELWHALHDGEDHELIACISASRWKRVERRARARFRALRVIGRVQRGSGLVLLAADGSRRRWRADEGGYSHGAR